LRDLISVVGFFVCANCASSSPLRTAVIKMSMTKGILLSDGMAIPFLPFSNSIGFPRHVRPVVAAEHLREHLRSKAVQAMAVLWRELVEFTEPIEISPRKPSQRSGCCAPTQPKSNLCGA
jgi:hypothetical protein